jgi:hypothetical protein
MYELAQPREYYGNIDEMSSNHALVTKLTP